MSGFGGSSWGFGAWGGGQELSSILDVVVDEILTTTDSVQYAAPLRVAQGIAATPLSVRVRFSAEIDSTYSPFLSLANYTISDLTVTSVSLADAYSVLLTTFPGQVGQSYTLTVAQGRSLNGDLLGTENSVTFAGFAVQPTFVAGAISDTQVDLIFSTPMTVDAALTAVSSYAIRGGPHGDLVPILAVFTAGPEPIRQVSLRLAEALRSQDSYAAIVSSAVTSSLGQALFPDTALFRWAGKALPTQGVPLTIDISDFSGEVSGGLLGTPLGQVFISPAYEAVPRTSTVEIDSISCCSRALDQYDFPELLDPPSLYTFGGATQSTLGVGFVLWGPAEKQGVARTNITDRHTDDVLPKVFDVSTGGLESPIADTPAIATLREPLDITRASFLNDLRWRTFPGTGNWIFRTADNSTPIGAGPTSLRSLTSPSTDVRDPYDTLGVLDEVEGVLAQDSDAISITDQTTVRLFGNTVVLVSDSVEMLDVSQGYLEKSALALDSLELTDQVEGALDSSLYGSLQTVYGPLLQGVWVGEDLVVDGSGDVTSWPDQTNAQILTNSSASRFRTRTVNGRTMLYSGVATGKSLASSGLTTSTYVIVATMPPLPFTDYKVALGAGSFQILAGGVATSSLYAAQSLRRYVDNVQTDAVTSGMHVLQATNTSSGNFFVGGLEEAFSGYPGRDWTADIGCVIALNGEPTSQQRANAQVVLEAYYGIT